MKTERWLNSECYLLLEYSRSCGGVVGIWAEKFEKCCLAPEKRAICRKIIFSTATPQNSTAEYRSVLTKSGLIVLFLVESEKLPD